MLTSDGAASTTSATGVAAVHQAIDEKRFADRTAHQIPMKLTALGCTSSLACVSENLSEVGCYTQLPTDSGLTVGQRCEIEFSPESEHLAGEVCYATVVRTENLAHPGGPKVGTGLRFDQPLYF